MCEDLAKWAKKILRVPKSRLFSASDGAQGNTETVFTPHGFLASNYLADFRIVVGKYQPMMQQSIATSGWPPPRDCLAWEPTVPSNRSLNVSGKHHCSGCRVGYSALWVHRGLCMVCERAKRDAGHCPWSQRCRPSSFCPHAGKCFVCDGWSCDVCRLVRGAGDDVVELVSRLNPSVIFLDFDRTLCSTKHGGSPLTGNHSIDPDLAAVASSHPNVHVVTRNSHGAEIRSFLSARGLEVAGVHVVGKKCGTCKADVMLGSSSVAGLLGDGDIGLFVDDDVNEHADPRVCSEPRLHRVLFVRGL